MQYHNGEYPFTASLKQVYTDVLVGGKKFSELSRTLKEEVLICCVAHEGWMDKSMTHEEYMTHVNKAKAFCVKQA